MGDGRDGNYCDVGALMRKRNRLHFYKDYRYKDIWELADAHQIPRSVALARHELGWPIEKIIEKPHKKEALDVYWRNTIPK